MWMWYLRTARIELPEGALTRALLIAAFPAFLGLVAVAIGKSVLRGRWGTGRVLVLVGAISLLVSPAMFFVFLAPGSLPCGGSVVSAIGSVLLLAAGLRAHGAA